jgi:hypothetical protein
MNIERDDFERRLDRLETSTRRWKILAIISLTVSTIIAAAELSAHARVAVAAPPDARYAVFDSVRVRALIVVDSGGRERARVAAPLPDPIILGKRVGRGGGVSGFLISDAEGNERGGYVTSDNYPNAFFTLDDVAAQRVLFIAEPQGATTLRIWNGSDVFTASVGDEGPLVRLDKDQKTIFRAPADSTKK